MARHSDNARERIVDGFEDLLIERGDAQVSLEAVALHVGLTKGGLLYHFRSRLALIEALIERYAARTADDVGQMQSAPEGAAANYLRISDYLASPLHRTTLAMGQLRSSEPRVVAALARTRDLELAALTADVGEPLLARLTMLFAEGLAYEAITGNETQPDTAAVIAWFTRHVLAVHAPGGPTS